MYTLKDVESYKTELKTHLTNTMKAAMALKSANSALAKLTAKSRVRFYLAEAMDDAIKVWLTPHCEAISQDYSGGTGIKFLVADMPTILTESPRTPLLKPAATDIDESDEEEIINQIVNKYDFSLLINSLGTAIKALEEQGVTAIADRTAENLGFKVYHSDNALKATKRNITFDMRCSGYLWNLKERFSALTKDLAYIESQTGETGFQAAFSALFLWMLANDATPSKRTFGSRSSVEIRVFTSHMRVCATHEAMDSLMSFLIANKSDSIELAKVGPIE